MSKFCFSVPVPTLARVPLAVNLGVIGLSSEWSGTLTQEDAIEQEKTFVRSKVRKHSSHWKM